MLWVLLAFLIVLAILALCLLVWILQGDAFYLHVNVQTGDIEFLKWPL